MHEITRKGSNPAVIVGLQLTTLSWIHDPIPSIFSMPNILKRRLRRFGGLSRSLFRRRLMLGQPSWMAHRWRPSVLLMKP
jgi:hypothetical protein